MATKYESTQSGTVPIKTGMLRTFTGKITEVHKGTGTLQVVVEVFGKLQSFKLKLLGC